jgi:hypothetical protein
MDIITYTTLVGMFPGSVKVVESEFIQLTRTIFTRSERAANRFRACLDNLILKWIELVRGVLECNMN